MSDEVFIDTTETVKWLENNRGVTYSRETISRYCIAGEFPGAYRASRTVGIGSQWFIPLSAVEAFENKRIKRAKKPLNLPKKSLGIDKKYKKAV